MHKLSLAFAIIAATFAANASAAPIQWTTGAGANGHWYEFVSAPVNWETAKNNAAASTYLGMTGYLATIISAEEQNFIFSSVGTGLAWIGGSDEWDATSENDEGVWKWVTGPEAGTVFWNRGTTTSYSNWSAGEPNNCCGGEDFLQFAWSGNGAWNDHGGPGNPGQLNGYLIEYSRNPTVQVPVPMTVGLIGIGMAGLLAARRRKA
ncbi:lectin-like protein [Chitinivorax sp. B]|uniref:lectin-like protein n=1 Tax=Chitinivorax sp. B TaxID=2502235 RepID=UPI001484D82F|nr:lectin-like protein [Chitinivorax sp. B]